MGKVKQKNRIRRNLILRALLDHGPLSLSDLKNTTGVSLPVVISLVTALKNEGLLTDAEHENPNHAGRPPQMVRLNGEAGYILGVDIGRIHTNFVLLDLARRVIADVRRRSVTLSNDISSVDILENEIREILASAGVAWERVLGAGVSLPGIVQGREGTSHTYFNFGRRSVRDVLTERFQKPVHIEHDVKAMALGELWFGQARGRKNVLCVNVGWGIGMGMIINGRVYYGTAGYAGEFGHIQIEPGGNLCYCGQRGCLETYASGQAIAAAAAAAVEAGEETVLLKAAAACPDGPDAKMVLQAAARGDGPCRKIVVNAADRLGFGLAQVINICNPELVILGGSISGAEMFFSETAAAAGRYSLKHLRGDTSFAVSELGYRAGGLGVAVLAARELFEVEHLNPAAYV